MFWKNAREPASARIRERHRKAVRVDGVVRYHLQVHVAGLRGARNDVVGSVQPFNIFREIFLTQKDLDLKCHEFFLSYFTHILRPYLQKSGVWL